MASAAIQKVEERLQTLLPSIYRDRIDEVQPLSMGSAPLAFDVDGNVAWDRIWGSFCDLAMAGGPPHKGKLLEAGTPEQILAEPVRYAEVCDEIARGIELAVRSKATPSSLPGWIHVQCSNHTMAEWLLRAITMENISVRLEEGAILLPAGPAFRLEKEIKNVITVTAKTTHYWCSHLIRLQQIGVANLFYQLDSEAPLLQPCMGRRRGGCLRPRTHRARARRRDWPPDHEKQLCKLDRPGLRRRLVSDHHNAPPRGKQHPLPPRRDRDLSSAESRRRSLRRTPCTLGLGASRPGRIARREVVSVCGRCSRIFAQYSRTVRARRRSGKNS